MVSSENLLTRILSNQNLFNKIGSAENVAGSDKKFRPISRPFQTQNDLCC